MAIPAEGTPITIDLRTKITQGDVSESFEFHENGMLLRTGRAMYIRYTEHGEDGMETPVTFKISLGGEIQLTRHAASDVHLPFSKDARRPTRYTTPGGSMLLDVETTSLVTDFQDVPFAGDIAIDYSLYQGDSLLGDYLIRLKVSE
jgi:uncharacterized beta-barrel protein YwiB (DUF1934 family)